MIVDQAAYWDKRTEEDEMVSSGTYLLSIVGGWLQSNQKKILKSLTENYNITSISA